MAIAQFFEKGIAGARIVFDHDDWRTLFDSCPGTFQSWQFVALDIKLDDRHVVEAKTVNG